MNINGTYLTELKQYNSIDNVIISKCSTRLYSGEHFHFLRRGSAPIPRTLSYSNWRRMRAASNTVELEMSGIKYLYIHAALQEFDLEPFLSLTSLDNMLPDTIAFIKSLAV